MADRNHRRAPAIALTNWATSWYFDSRRAARRGEECRADLTHLREIDRTGSWACWRYALSTTRGVLWEPDKAGLQHAAMRVGAEMGYALLGLGAIAVALTYPYHPALFVLLAFTARLGIMVAVGLVGWTPWAMIVCSECVRQRRQHRGRPAATTTT